MRYLLDTNIVSAVGAEDLFGLDAQAGTNAIRGFMRLHPGRASVACAWRTLRWIPDMIGAAAVSS